MEIHGVWIALKDVEVYIEECVQMCTGIHTVATVVQSGLSLVNTGVVMPKVAMRRN